MAERRKKAEKAAAKAKKGGRHPLAGGGLSWRHRQDLLGQGVVRQSGALQRLLPIACRAARTYVRNGSVIDLKITPGAVQAQVVGSSLYQVDVTVARGSRKRSGGPSAPIARARSIRWWSCCRAGSRKRRDGTHLPPGHRPFPGARGDQVQLQLPGLGRDVQARRRRALRRRRAPRSAAGVALQRCAGSMPRRWSRRQAPACRNQEQGPAADKVLDDADLADVFGIEMAEPAPTPALAQRKHRSVKTPGTTPQAKAKSERALAAKQTAAMRKKRARKSAKTVPRKPATTKPPAPLPAGSRKIAGKTSSAKVTAGVAVTAAKTRASTQVAAKRS